MSGRGDTSQGRTVAWRGWAGWLLGPAAWAVQLNVGFAIGTWFCDDVPSAGTWLLSVGCGAVALVGLLLAIAGWRAAGGGHAGDALADEHAQRAAHSVRFVCLSGAVLSALGLLGIVVTTLATTVLGGC